MTIFILVVIHMLMSQNLWAESTKQEQDLVLLEARIYLAGGDVQKAKTMTQGVLREDASDSEAQSLLREIMDQEIAADAPAASLKVTEELSAEEKQLEIDRWMERARTLLSLHQYDEAALAVEKVFIYEPEHLAASRLMDEIRLHAMKEGNQEINAFKKETQDEVHDRIHYYETQADEWMRKEQFGAARLAAEKILILDPVNSKALNLKEQIRKRLENEKRKTL